MVYKTTPEYKERKRLKRKDECPYCDGMKTKTADGCWDCKPKIPRLRQQLQLDKEKWRELMHGAKELVGYQTAKATGIIKRD